MTPRDYQISSIERLTKALPRFGVCLDASDTGVGKTYVAAFTAKALGWKVAVVCPKSVVPSWELALKTIGVPYLFIENPERIRYQAQWGEVCKDGFGWQWKIPERCLTIFDECFVAGTMISTPQGKKPIETVVVGDFVSTPHGPKRVLRTIKNEGHFKIVNLTNTECRVSCTPNHKFYDGNTFTPVSEMRLPAWAENQSLLLPELCYANEEYTRVCGQKDGGFSSKLGRPRKEEASNCGIQSIASAKTTNNGAMHALPDPFPNKASDSILLSLLHFFLDCLTPARHRSEAASYATRPALRGFQVAGCRHGTDDKTQPHKKQRNSGQNIRQPSWKTRPSPNWGEWARTNGSAIASLWYSWRDWVHNGSWTKVGEGEPFRVAGGFAVRFSLNGGKAGVGNRRVVTQYFRSPPKGRKKTGASDPAWVESATIPEHQHPQSIKPVRSQHTVAPITIESQGTASTVYDLEVEGVHCYYANGFLVSNCHRFSGADSLQAKMLASAPKPVLMLSATCADSPLKMHAIGHQLGIVHWDKWFEWCFKNGCVFNKPFRGLKYVGNDEVLKRIHNQIFAEKGVRIRIADLGDAFPDNSVEAVPIPLENVWEVNAEYIKAIELLEEEAPNAAVAMLRARQLSEHRKLRAMIDMTDDLLENGKSVAIFVCFRESLDQLAKQFPEASLIYGDQPADERADAIREFQSNQNRIIIAMIQAGGVGINLHDLDGNFPRVSLINPSFSAIELIQTLGRIHRNGGKSPCIQRILFAAETIEERVREKVELKVDRINLLNDSDLHL